MQDIKNFWLGAGVGLAGFAAVAAVVGAVILGLETLKPILGMGAAIMVLYALVLVVIGGFIGVATGRNKRGIATDTAAQRHVEGRA